LVTGSVSVTREYGLRTLGPGLGLGPGDHVTARSRDGAVWLHKVWRSNGAVRGPWIGTQAGDLGDKLRRVSEVRTWKAEKRRRN